MRFFVLFVAVAVTVVVMGLAPQALGMLLIADALVMALVAFNAGHRGGVF